MKKIDNLGVTWQYQGNEHCFFVTNSLPLRHLKVKTTYQTTTKLIYLNSTYTTL